MSIISNYTESVIKDAAASLLSGNLVAFPTETVYGLGANATSRSAVARVYEVKGRPISHPLIVHISSVEHLDKWARDIPEHAIKLARAFWPGPMTLILPRTKLAKNFITGNQDSVGIRVPLHTIAQELLKEFESLGGLGVAAPSANRFGKLSPTTAEAVEIELGKKLNFNSMILDGGPSLVGIESTIISCISDEFNILRPGAITKQMIEAVTGMPIQDKLIGNEIKAPGLLEKHYLPKTMVLLSGIPELGDGFIALAAVPTPSGTIRLASPISNKKYAQVLYHALREADKNGIKRTIVIPPNGSGVAVAINDRLKKLATCSIYPK